MIWIIGHTGLLGGELSKLVELKGIPYLKSPRSVDITNFSHLRDYARYSQNSYGKIDTIINCSGYTMVDDAELYPDLAFAANAYGVANIASCAHELGARLLHISTDYVFDGTKVQAGTGIKVPYHEADGVNPLSIYGQSKVAGEQFAFAMHDQICIIRSSWLYGAGKINFVSKILTALENQHELRVVADQVGCPTWSQDLAAVVLELALNQRDLRGIFHYAGSGHCSWYDFAVEIQRIALSIGLSRSSASITPVETSGFPARAKRPRWSVLDTSKIEGHNISTYPWQKSLQRYLGA